MSPRGPGAVALTLGFTSLRSHPVPSLQWGCENTIKLFFLDHFYPGAISPMGAISRMITVFKEGATLGLEFVHTTMLRTAYPPRYTLSHKN